MNTVQLTKRQARLFVRDKAKSHSADAASHMLDSVRYTDCTELLLRCRDMYDRLAGTRAQMRRATDYVMGRQWSDYIEDPDSRFSKRQIKEEDYIKRQGKIPLKYNVIKKSAKSIVGLYRNNRPEPTAVAHDRDEQRLGEMMTIALQYAYKTNHVSELNARQLESCFCTGLFARSCYYRWNDERQISDVSIQNENPYNIFFSSDTSDVLMRDISLIGAIRDMSLQDLVSAFAHSETEVRMLAEEYRNISDTDRTSSYYDTFDYKKQRDTDFYTPPSPNLCRVYEVWTKESEECYYCHDTAKGEECYRPLSERAAIDAENERRRNEMVALGYSPDDARLINYRWHIRKYWYVRYLTPTGKCILGGASPFEHGSHPFTIGAFPLLNGEIQSPAEELIDVQRAINRTLTQIDFIRQNGAKGVLMCPVDAVPDNMSYSDFATEYTRSGSVLFYKPKAGVPVPTPIHTSSVAPGDLEVIQLYMRLGDDISGITGALRGEQRNNTAASLYAQEAQNSSNNIADFMGWFNTCVECADNKVMKTIQQYYDDTRYIPIAGRNFSEQSKWYNPDKIRQSEFDLTISESTATPAYRMAIDQTLKEALNGQFIDFKTYLEASPAPFADSILEIVKRNEANGQITPEMAQQIGQITEKRQTADNGQQ